MSKLDTVMESLDDTQRRQVVEHMIAAWRRPLSGLERSRRWRDRASPELRDGPSPGNATGRHEETQRTVTELRDGASPPPPAPPEVRASSKASRSNSNGSKKQRSYRPETLEILEFLNNLAGKSFRPVHANLRFIEDRMASGATISNCKGVIARKVREWKNDPDHKKYLRPATLFNETKFEQYLGERAPESGDDHGA